MSRLSQLVSAQGTIRSKSRCLQELVPFWGLRGWIGSRFIHNVGSIQIHAATGLALCCGEGRLFQLLETAHIPWLLALILYLQRSRSSHSHTSNLSDIPFSVITSLLLPLPPHLFNSSVFLPFSSASWHIKSLHN